MRRFMFVAVHLSGNLFSQECVEAFTEYHNNPEEAYSANAQCFFFLCPSVPATATVNHHQTHC